MMRPLTLSVIVAVLASLVGWPSVSNARWQSEQQPPAKSPQEQEIRLIGPLVTLGVRVTDRKGRDVHGLKAEDFSLYEDGAAQPIAFFSEEEQPISLGILLDKSHSMSESGKLERAKTAALALVNAGHSGNEFLYIPFNNEVAVAVAFTMDRARVETAISGTATEGGGTSLYDAIMTGLDRLAHARHPRQALVVITDGADQHSRYTLDEVIQTLQASQAQLYLIGYFSPVEDDMFRRSGKTIRLISGQEIDNLWC